MGRAAGMLSHHGVADWQSIVIERDEGLLIRRRVTRARDSCHLRHHHVKVSAQVVLADIAAVVDGALLYLGQRRRVIATIAMIGVKGGAQVLDRLHAVVAMRVEDGGNQPHWESLDEQTIELSVEGIPFLHLPRGGIDRRLVDDNGGAGSPCGDGSLCGVDGGLVGDGSVGVDDSSRRVRRARGSWPVQLGGHRRTGERAIEDRSGVNQLVRHVRGERHEPRHVITAVATEAWRALALGRVRSDDTRAQCRKRNSECHATR